MNVRKIALGAASRAEAHIMYIILSSHKYDYSICDLFDSTNYIIEITTYLPYLEEGYVFTKYNPISMNVW